MQTNTTAYERRRFHRVGTTRYDQILNLGNPKLMDRDIQALIEDYQHAC